MVLFVVVVVCIGYGLGLGNNIGVVIGFGEVILVIDINGIV